MRSEFCDSFDISIDTVGAQKIRIRCGFEFGWRDIVRFSEAQMVVKF